MPQPDSAIKEFFALGWEEFKKNHPGKVPGWMDRSIRKMLACRTEKLGCHFLRCEDGTCETPHFRLIPHSCKQRICSCCGKVGNDNWLAKIQEITLPIVHHHITFTVPFEPRPLIAANLVVLLNALYETSAKAVMKYAGKELLSPNGSSYSEGISDTISTLSMTPVEFASKTARFETAPRTNCEGNHSPAWHQNCFPSFI